MLELVEKTLDEVLPRDEERPSLLSSAMRYAVGTGGKRIRPLVCLAAAEAVGGAREDAKYPAAAIELLHNYTLIHDDLPAMDNDTVRRGRPTVWKMFGEANAILAGDALLALAYRVAAKAPRNVPAIVDTLGRYGVGVVMGQIEDISPGKPKDVDFVYEHKTADLFMASAVMGALAGGGDASMVEQLRVFAEHLGLAFQFEDDLLDGDSPYSEADTRALVDRHSAAAVSELEGLPGDTGFLSGLVRRLVDRKV